MKSCCFRLLYLVLLAGCLQGTAATQESICSRDPELQILDQSIHNFGCHIDETIHALNCSGKGIPALPETHDTGVPVGIEIFDFSYNKIKCLPKINNTRASCSVTDCHAGCLLDLRLQHNEIDFLHQEVFGNLTCLRSLDLSHNFITNQTIKRNHFFKLSQLQHLDLHGNPLHTLPDNVLITSHLSHLHTLNLSHCQLEKIGELAIDDFFEMVVLDLSNNKLSRLAVRTFKGLMNLKILDLRWNRLEVIEKDTFADMRELQELRLDHNRLTSISGLAFHRQPQLGTLGLFRNNFETMPFHALYKLTKLRSLDMSHNPIEILKPGHVNTSITDLKLDHLDSLTEVMDEAFSAFPHLSSMSLRFCGRLTTIPARAFQGSTSQLREVQLDHNGLQQLPEDLLPWTQLSLLTLQDNPWHCDCRMGWASGQPLGNSTLRCEEPLKLKGQELHTLTGDELPCEKDIVMVQAVIGLSLTLLILTTLVIIFCQRKRRMLCWCLRGDQGRYVTIYTKEKRGTDAADDDDDDDLVNGTCGEGEIGDLDLGNGEGPSSEGGRVMLLINSFRHGYRRLQRSRGGESSQDLTKATDV